jgi:hypothetical protein
MPTVIIEHEATIWIRSGLTVVVDDRAHGIIKPRSKIDVLVTPGHHRIWMASKRVTSPIVAFKAEEREEYGFVCKSSGLFKRRVTLHHSYARKQWNRFDEPRSQAHFRDAHRPMNVRTSGEDWATILRVRPDASPGEIRKAYLKLISIYHPDRIGHLPHDSRMIADQESRRINLAYQSAKNARGHR